MSSVAISIITVITAAVIVIVVVITGGISRRHLFLLSLFSILVGISIIVSIVSFFPFHFQFFAVVAFLLLELFPGFILLMRNPTNEPILHFLISQAISFL
jgi:hypothetical protein